MLVAILAAIAGWVVFRGLSGGAAAPPAQRELTAVTPNYAPAEAPPVIYRTVTPTIIYDRTEDGDVVRIQRQSGGRVVGS